MLLRNKFFFIITISIGIIVFSISGLAQETKTTTTQEKTEKQKRVDGREFGRHTMGRGGFAGRHGGPEMVRGKLMRGLHGLNLTDYQKSQIRSILEANKPVKANVDEIKAIRESRKAGTPLTDEQKAKLKSIREQAQAKAKSVHEQILAVLTAEQKAQIEKRKEEFKQRHQDRMQRPERKPMDRKTGVRRII